MARPRVFIVRAPGTNCDQETAYAFEKAGAAPEVFHLNRWLESPHRADDFQIICFPGGFSFGDDVAAGRMVAVRMQKLLADSLQSFIQKDRLVLGICNGFQILIKSGLLLKPDAAGRPIGTLDWNDHGRYEDRWVKVAADQTHCVFLRGVEKMELPIAHAEGKFECIDEATLGRLKANGQLALRYVSESITDEQLPFPINPNGSTLNVAGICDETGRVFGLMPHPERHIDVTHHPSWTRRKGQCEKGDGMIIFENAVEYFGS